MATTIKEIFDRLTPSEKRALNYAFETGVPHYVVMGAGRYIGVNIKGNTSLVPDTEVGKWSTGIVRR